MLAAAGCATSDEPAAPPSTGSAGTAQWQNDVAVGQTTYPRSVRRPAPALSGPTLEGGRLNTADLAGRVVVVNVWASWCGPCEDEAPTLAALDAAFRGRGVRFVGLDLRDDDAAAREFADRFGIAYPSIIDRDGSLATRLAPWLPVKAIPGTVVIDRDGRVAAAVIGKVRRAGLAATLEDLLDDHQRGERHPRSSSA